MAVIFSWTRLAAVLVVAVLEVLERVMEVLAAVTVGLALAVVPPGLAAVLAVALVTVVLVLVVCSRDRAEQMTEARRQKAALSQVAAKAARETAAQVKSTGKR